MRIGSLLVAVALLTACGGSSATTTTAATTTTSTTSPMTITTTTTTTALLDVLVIPPAGEMAAAWTEVVFVPYGDGEDTLGTAPGGDAGSLDLGPEYGAQAPDGSWWFLDAAKLRVAHFTEEGDFIEGLAVPAAALIGGVFFQYQMPRVLDDGTLIASGFGTGETRLLLVSDGVVSAATFPMEVGVQGDDGRLLYGHAFSEPTGPVVVDVAAGTTESAEWFLTRSEARYRVTSTGDRLRIEIPEIGFDHTFALVAGEVGGPAFASVEVATGEDGSIHLLLLGLPEANESVQLAGYLAISGEGTVGPVEPIRNPFSSSDPGSPSHLGVRPGSSDPWLMFVDEDGVRVYDRG